MLDSSIIQVLVVLGFPYFIRGIRSVFSKPSSPSPLQRLGNKRMSQWNRSVMVLLGLTTLYHLFNVTLYSPPNIFRTLSLPADCPNFILHQSWKLRAELDPGFMDMYPDSMRERFKAMENRLVYEVYGQDAFLNCEHCTERSDYLLYLTPGALASYVGMAAILGIATTQTSHLNKYRTWGSAALVLLAIIEYGTYQKGAEIVSLPSLKLKGTLVGYRGAHLIRHGFLAMMSVVMTGLLLRVTRGGGVRDEVEILNDLCQAQEVMIQRHRALQLARVASLRDPALRTQFVEYWRSREVEYGLLLADKDFKEAREQARSRIDVAAVTQEADEYIDAIMKAGERQAEGTSSSTAPDETLTRVGQEMAPLHLGTN